jgi:UDP-glucose 4-epimerase
MIESIEKMLVVGAKGFIGSSLMSAISKSGKVSSITTIANSREFSDFLRNHISLKKYKRIVWLAGKVNPSTASTNPRLVDLELRQFTEMIESAYSYFSSLENFILLSSAGCVYPHGLEALDESCPPAPTNEYGILKLKMEKLLCTSGIPYSILRVSNVFGKSQPTGRGQGVIGEWISNILIGKECNVYGSIRDFRDFIEISDVVRAIQLTLDYGPVEIINVGSGLRTSIQDLIDIFTRNTSLKPRFNFWDSRSFDGQGYFLNINRAKDILGWNPTLSDQDKLELFIQTELKNERGL